MGYITYVVTDGSLEAILLLVGIDVKRVSLNTAINRITRKQT